MDCNGLSDVLKVAAIKETFCIWLRSARALALNIISVFEVVLSGLIVTTANINY